MQLLSFYYHITTNGECTLCHPTFPSRYPSPTMYYRSGPGQHTLALLVVELLLLSFRWTTSFNRPWILRERERVFVVVLQCGSDGSTCFHGVLVRWLDGVDDQARCRRQRLRKTHPWTRYTHIPFTLIYSRVALNDLQMVLSDSNVQLLVCNCPIGLPAKFSSNWTVLIFCLRLILLYKQHLYFDSRWPI